MHNLKNIEVEIPHNRLVVITGLSGSGKSTLAFDTIFAEGQRRYVESLSAYARQFLGKINKPDVDVITGIAPAIAIEQKVNTRNPRSTVGTTTELYDYLKLLYARIGHTFSPVSGQEVKCYTEDDVAQYILSLPEGSRVAVAAPLQLREGQGVIEKLTLVLGEGILRVHAAGETLPIEDFLPRVDENTRAEDISIVVDRAKVSQDGDLPTRLRDSVARAFSYGNGVCQIITPEGVKGFSARFEADGIEFEPPTEHLFSFNNPLGACPTCEGYGKIIGIDEDLVIPDKRKTIYEDAVACWRGETMRAWKDQLVANAYKFDFPIHTPFYQLTAEQKRLLWCGNEYFHGLNDFFAYIDSERRKIQFRVMKARYTGKTVCPDCGGSRLRKEALYVRIGGKTIADLVVMPVETLANFFATLELDAHDTKTAARILTEIRNRLQYLTDVGLGYLTLDRLSATLSGGESQRINLSTSLGSNLVGSLYILDEPSIGLHPRDTNRLVGVLEQLRDIGNTVIVVEHEEEVIRAADWIVDIGPEAGYNGGEVVFSGPLKALLKENAGNQIELTIAKRIQGEWNAYTPFHMDIVNDSIDKYIAYRLLALSNDMWNRMGIYQRNLENYDQSVIYENSLTDYNCVNCHTFSSGNPDKMIFHMRGKHAGSVLIDGKKITKLNTKTPETVSNFVYMYWHPNGNYLAATVCDTYQNFFINNPNTLEVLDHNSDIVIYDVKKNEVFSCEALNSKDAWQIFPAFSPDGKSLYFSSTAAVDSISKNFRQMTYSLCRVDFDPETRTLGQQVDTLYNGRANHKSVSFPRISPDGKYLAFTLQEYGGFGVWHKDAELYMIRLSDGKTYPLSEANSAEGESYHSWSHNNRWLVFSSRRLDGLYLSLIHI